MNIAGFYPESSSNGEGLRAVIFVSGCPHMCPGCHNAEQQELGYGNPIEQEKENILNSIKNNTTLKGITLSGGDPFYEPNVKELVELVREFKDMNIWCYTGYKLEQLLNRGCAHTSELLSYIDVLIDGKYIKSKYDSSLIFRGSSNQRIIDVQKTLKDNELHLYEMSIFPKF